MVSDFSLQNIDNIILNELSEHIETSKLLYDLLPEISSFYNSIINTLRANNKILICGNGGSAADAQHFSSELIGKFERDRKPLAALSLSTDTSAITSISNDFSFDDVFSRQIRGIGSKGDLLIVISTSGNSKNILNAINIAKEKDITCIGLLGRDGGLAIKQIDSSITIKSNRTCRIQEMHSIIIHIICSLIEKNTFD